MSRRRWATTTVCILAAMAILGSPERTLMAGDSAQRLQEMVGRLPERIEVWRRAESEVYGPQNLYRYINGGAELYISFQFTALVSQPYVREDGVEIRLDIFDMGSAASAYGIFCHSREATDDFVAAGVESEYAGGLLHFWKGRYYASLLAYPETESGQALVRELARGIAAQIDDRSGPPDVIALLPETDRVEHSERWFRHHAWLNEYHDFGDENVLQLGDRTEVAMARYRPAGVEKSPVVLIVLRYPDAETAAAACESFTAALLPRAEDGLQAGADGKWLGCRQAGDLVIVTAGALERDKAASLLRAAQNVVQKTEPGE